MFAQSTSCTSRPGPQKNKGDRPSGKLTQADIAEYLLYLAGDLNDRQRTMDYNRCLVVLTHDEARRAAQRLMECVRGLRQ